MSNKVLKEFKTSTGGTVQVFSWGLRHISGKSYSGAGAEMPETVADQPKRGRGRPRKA